VSVAKVSRAIALEVVRLLKKERERQGVSKYTLASKSGLSQQMIGYVEREMRNPTLETVLRMAEGLELDLATIIKKAQKRVR